MNLAGLVRYAGSLVALAMCAACGGTLRQAQGDVAIVPPAAALSYQYVGKMLFVNGRPVTAARPNSMPAPRYAALLPDAQPQSRDYEYVINFYGSYASIFDYPKSTQEIGQINNVGGQGCTNVLYGYGERSFWIVAAYNQITLYRVPKRPIRTLAVSIGMPSSCAMDNSGDLAVGILNGSGQGDIVIFKNGTSSGSVFATPLSAEYFDGYDNQGNLFADGFTSSGKFALVELPKDSSKFVTITTSNTVQFPGSVQWDGTYLTVFDQSSNATYQYTVSGTKATLQHTVSYSGASDCAQTWIVKGLIYCGDAGNDGGEVFSYPAGGAAVATLTGSFDLPLGVVAAKR